MSQESHLPALQRARTVLHEHIVGQEEVVEQVLVCLLAGGHGLLVGVPGLAKTTLVRLAGAVLGLETGRIQCTPDLMPGDILGSEVLEQDEQGKKSFRLIKGPVFCQLLIADEINRASPKTQSALLQAMQEHEVTLAGKTWELPVPFQVLATQNPLEQEGTYPLPEAQLDRFLLQITLDYPDRTTEEAIITRTSLRSIPTPERVLETGQLTAAQQAVNNMAFAERIVSLIAGLVQATRPEQGKHPLVKQYLTWGCGPRAGQALLKAACARAWLDERHAPSQEDLQALAIPVLRHRLGLSYAARADGMTTPRLLSELMTSLWG